MEEAAMHNHHWSAQEFREHGHRAVDWIANYMETVDSFPVRSTVEPGSIRAKLPPHPPEQGESFDAVLRDIDSIIMPGITHWQSPNFFAYYPSNSSGPAVLGDLLSSGLGVQGMLWSTSPAATELESHVLDWLVEALALPQRFSSTGPGGGVIQDSASSATLCALLAARERATNYTNRTTGFERGVFTVYTSQETHSSLDKAVMIAGIGLDRLRKIPTNAALEMDVSRLRKAMVADRTAGLEPLMVAGTVGTTSTGAVDPIAAIGELCSQQRVWLHVDGAMFGSAAVCPETRAIHAGLEFADSYCFNPHKWLLTNFDCDCMYVADREPLVRSMSVLPEYLKNDASESGSVVDYRDWHIPLGRRFRSLKLWLVLRHYGLEGLRAHIRHHLELAEWFATQVADDPAFELVVPRSLPLVCFRHRSDDSFNEALLENINASGRAFLTHTRVKGQYALRMALGGAATDRKHVESTWRLIQTLAANLSGS